MRLNYLLKYFIESETTNMRFEYIGPIVYRMCKFYSFSLRILNCSNNQPENSINAALKFVSVYSIINRECFYHLSNVFNLIVLPI